MGPGAIYQLYSGLDGPKALGGMVNLPPQMPGPPHWMVYVSVGTLADLEAACARVTAGGGKILNGPMEVPGGEKVAQCLDAQGAAFALHGVPATT